MSVNLSDIRSRVGILGGLQTALLYSHETRVQWGSKGGRPRSKTLVEILARNERVSIIKKENKEVELPGSYPQLKKLAKALRMEILSRSPSSN